MPQQNRRKAHSIRLFLFNKRTDGPSDPEENNFVWGKFIMQAYHSPEENYVNDPPPHRIGYPKLDG